MWKIKQTDDRHEVTLKTYCYWLSDYYLMSSKQYFSHIQDDTAFDLVV
jgi:hypothetical protein